MAQASSAQREPSMEEILASIRRIIEDSDTARGEDSMLTVEDLHDDEDEDFSGSAGGAEVESFRAELKPESGRTVTSPSLAEIRSSLNESDFSQSAETFAAETDVSQGDTHSEFRPTFGESGAPLAAISDDDVPSVAQTGRGASAEDNANAAVDEYAGNEPAKPLMISETAGRKVAAAFEELSEAFEASRRKSFDEMAEEMLRPMLQDWLDNNLPTLVERLVREEIERVARGGAK